MLCYAMLPYLLETRNLRDCFESLIGGGGGGGGGQEGRELANMRSGNVPKVGGMDARGGETSKVPYLKVLYLPSIMSYYRLLDNNASIRERHVL